MPTRKYLNVGSTPNDGRGDTLRDAAEKIEYNFEILFGGLGAYVVNANTTIYQSGVSILANGNSMLLQDGSEIGEERKLVSTSNTVTVAGTYSTGNLLTMQPSSACALIWTGTSWALFSDTGISVT